VGSLIAAFGSNWPTHPVAGRVAIAFVYIYDVNFSYSWAPIGWVLPSEIFPLALRSTGISITTSCTWMSNFVIGLVSPIMLTTLANGGTYFFFLRDFVYWPSSQRFSSYPKPRAELWRKWMPLLEIRSRTKRSSAWLPYAGSLAYRRKCLALKKGRREKLECSINKTDMVVHETI